MSKPGRVLDTMQRLRPSPEAGDPAAAKPKKARKRKAGNDGNGRADTHPATPKVADAPRAAPRREPPPAASAGTEGQQPAVDIEAFSRNIARMVEQGGRALAAYLKPR